MKSSHRLSGSSGSVCFKEAEARRHPPLLEHSHGLYPERADPELARADLEELVGRQMMILETAVATMAVQEHPPLSVPAARSVSGHPTMKMHAAMSGIGLPLVLT